MQFFFVWFCVLLVWIYRSAFVPTEKFKDLIGFSGLTKRIRNKIALSMLLSLFIPVLIFVLATQIELTFTTEILISIYSSILEVTGALLGILVTVSLFILSEKQNKTLRPILGRSVKALSILYAITLLVAIMGLVSVPSDNLFIDPIGTTINQIYFQTLFIFTIGLFMASIVYLILIFAEIVEANF